MDAAALHHNNVSAEFSVRVSHLSSIACLSGCEVQCSCSESLTELGGWSLPARLVVVGACEACGRG